MATKAQLETELAALREQLARRETASDEGISDSGPDEIDPADTEGASASEIEEDIADWEEQIQDVVKELKELPHKKPLLLALGALALGYLIGRSK